VSVLINPYALVPLAAAASVSYTGTVSGAGFTSSHSLSIAVGTAATGRLVVVAVHALHTGSVGVSSATIGGVSASISSAVNWSNAGSYYATTFIWAVVPTGTTATVALTLPSNAYVVLRAWRVVDLVSTTPGDTATVTTNSSKDLSLSIDVVAGGVLIAASTGVFNSAYTATAGVTLDYSGSAWSTYARHGGGSADISVTAAPTTVTFHRTTNSVPGSNGWAAVALAFR
jgi:hypothetical protein